jgi:hypothetical protein
MIETSEGSVSLPTPSIAREPPIAGSSFERPDPALIRQLHAVSSATANQAGCGRQPAEVLLAQRRRLGRV